MLKTKKIIEMYASLYANDFEIFLSRKKFSIKKLNELLRIRNKKMYCFPDMVVTVLSNLGINAKYYTASNDIKSYKEGKKYLLKNYPKKVAEDIWKMTNLKISRPFFKKALKEKRYIRKTLSFMDIEKFFKKGYLISPVINVNVFKKKNGYAGHAVLITDIDKKFVIFHDPGLSPIPNNKIKKQDFIKAWQAPGIDNTVIVVFGKKNKINLSK